MKISDNKGFEPITITVETQGEADLLAAALGRVAGDGRHGDMLYKIYCALDREDREIKASGLVTFPGEKEES